MVKTNLPPGGEPISVNPTHDEILDTYFENIFKRLRKIDITLDYITNEINKTNKELPNDH